jgi:hypothetical protein
MADLFGNAKIYSLSLHQPFASLMRHGKIETRTWRTKVRGLVLLHSTKTILKPFELSGYSHPWQVEKIEYILKGDKSKNLYGYAVAFGELVDCRPMKKSDEDRCFVKYHSDLFCHVYENVQVLNPFEYKAPIGTRKWGIVSDQNVLEKLRLQGIDIFNQ